MKQTPYASKLMFCSFSQISDFLQNVIAQSVVRIAEVALTVQAKVVGLTGQWPLVNHIVPSGTLSLGAIWQFFIGWLVAKHTLTCGPARGHHVAVRGPLKFWVKVRVVAMGY